MEKETKQRNVHSGQHVIYRWVGNSNSGYLKVAMCNHPPMEKHQTRTLRPSLGGLQVAVDAPVAVQVAHPQHQLLEQEADGVLLQRPVLQRVLQQLTAVHVLHHLRRGGRE